MDSKTRLMRYGLRSATAAIDAARSIATHERVGARDHRTIIPEATYCPWRVDVDFQRAHRAIAAHTLVDVPRLYELWSLAGQMSDIRGDYLEVGVWRGGSAALVGQRFLQTGGASRRVVLCDTFSGVALAGEQDGSYSGGEHADTSVEIVERLFEDCLLDGPEIHIGIFPTDTGQAVADRSFSLVHVDVDVYESALHAAEYAWPLMTVGGAMVFDDYGFVKTQGVRRAVDELGERFDCCLRIHNLNGHGLLLKSG